MNALEETSHTVLQTDLWTAGIKTFATLCLVLGALILVLFLLKRYFFRDQRCGLGTNIKMISSYHISPKQRIALLDIVGEKWIVGISPESMTCLGKLENEDGLEKMASEKSCDDTGMLFQRFFQSSLKKRKSSGGHKE